MDRSYLGRTYPPTAPYQVGREKIREFATAVGATDPIHHDPEAARARGFTDVVAPPTFPIVVADVAGKQVTRDPDLGMDYSRVVHGDQRFVHARPVVAGDELICTVTIEDMMARGGHEMLTCRTELTTPAGEHVVSVWTKLVVRGETGNGG